MRSIKQPKIKIPNQSDVVDIVFEACRRRHQNFDYEQYENAVEDQFLAFPCRMMTFEFDESYRIGAADCYKVMTQTRDRAVTMMLEFFDYYSTSEIDAHAQEIIFAVHQFFFEYIVDRIFFKEQVQKTVAKDSGTLTLDDRVLLVAGSTWD
jgi:hypothetical protein